MARPCATVAYYRVQYTYFTLCASSGCVQSRKSHSKLCLSRSIFRCYVILHHSVGITRPAQDPHRYIIL